jgi:hypothetical protein
VTRITPPRIAMQAFDLGFGQGPVTVNLDGPET